MWSTLVIVSYCCRKPTTIYLFACALWFGQGEPGTRNSIVKINQTDFTLVTVFAIVTVIVFSLVLARLFRCSSVFTSCSSSPNIYLIIKPRFPQICTLFSSPSALAEVRTLEGSLWHMARRGAVAWDNKEKKWEKCCTALLGHSGWSVGHHHHPLQHSHPLA